ncbi:hypothetical protein CHN51_14025 [Sphingorhabdus sp. YGSMI21]|nr:hypothetical protein CHN51_14025 [Sphingorhabdus sp. YGSMI21]
MSKCGYLLAMVLRQAQDERRAARIPFMVNLSNHDSRSRRSFDKLRTNGIIKPLLFKGGVGVVSPVENRRQFYDSSLAFSLKSLIPCPTAAKPFVVSLSNHAGRLITALRPAQSERSIV